MISWVSLSNPLDPICNTKKRKTSQTQRYSQSNRVLLCMVGLPARGKSYITKMLMRYLTSLGRKRSCLQANWPMGISSELIIAGTLLKVFPRLWYIPLTKMVVVRWSGFPVKAFNAGNLRRQTGRCYCITVLGSFVRSGCVWLWRSCSHFWIGCGLKCSKLLRPVHFRNHLEFFMVFKKRLLFIFVWLANIHEMLGRQLQCLCRIFQ